MDGRGGLKEKDDVVGEKGLSQGGRRAGFWWIGKKEDERGCLVLV